MLTEGLQHTSAVKVTENNTAITMGSGDMSVFATPAAVMQAETPHTDTPDASVVELGSSTRSLRARRKPKNHTHDITTQPCMRANEPAATKSRNRIVAPRHTTPIFMKNSPCMAGLSHSGIWKQLRMVSPNMTEKKTASKPNRLMNGMFEITCANIEIANTTTNDQKSPLSGRESSRLPM